MKRIVRGLVDAILGCGVLLAIGEGCARYEEAVESDPAAVGELGRPGPKTFRNTFAHYLRKDGYDDDAIHDLVYLAPDGVTDPKVEHDPDAPLARVDAAFQGLRPSALYEHGRRTPMQDSVDVEAALSARPVHIVVLPGIFGEFIDVAPFEEVLAARGSAAAMRWERSLAAKSGSPDATDETFDPIAMREVSRPLSSLVRTGSIDGPDGEALVTISYLTPPLGSLESLGTLEENANVYLRRLRKVFAVVGAEQDIYVLGYSRGAATALEVVARAARDPSAHPWTSRLRGVISLAGVLYGSQLADDARRKGTPQADVIEVIEELASDLETCTQETPLPTRLRVQTANGARWTAAVTKAAWLATKLPRHQEIDWEGIDTAAPDVSSLATFARRLLTTDLFTLTTPLTDYCQNVDRFKVTVQKVLAGIDSLTTDSRVEWWRTHTLPADIRYFALTGTMGDATREPGRAWHKVKNTSSYDPRSIDFASLRANYYDLFAASGAELNDSQVTIARAKFWPSLTPLLNPRQQSLETYFLGTLGTHHWGLAFPRAFATRDGRTANPYPRKALAHALGAFVSVVAAKERR